MKALLRAAVKMNDMARTGGRRGTKNLPALFDVCIELSIVRGFFVHRGSQFLFTQTAIVSVASQFCKNFM